MNETKKDKFCRLAENRVNSVLKGLQLLGNLANTSNYDYTEEDVNKMIRTLKKAVDTLENTYKSKIEKRCKKFTFK